MAPLNKNKGSISHQRAKETQEQQTKQEKKDPKGGGCSKYIDNQNLKLHKYTRLHPFQNNNELCASREELLEYRCDHHFGVLIDKVDSNITDAYAF
jgi:hypothetical protein